MKPTRSDIECPPQQSDSTRRGAASSAAPYRIVTSTSSSVQIQLLTRPQQARLLLQNAATALEGVAWPDAAIAEKKRKLQVLQALGRYGDFSAYFSHRLSAAYARRGDHLLCFFADFDLLASSSFASVWRVRLPAIFAFTEKFGNAYFLLIRKEVNQNQYRELREAGGLRAIEPHEVFHFLLLHETYHYLHAQFHRDLRDPVVASSAAYAIQEYNANRWAGSELKSWMATEFKGEHHETSF